MPFLDGTNEEHVLQELWRFIHANGSRSSEDLDRSFSETICSLTEKSRILQLKGEASPSLNGARDYLIPDLSCYECPHGRLERPLGVTVTLTNRCDVNCRYCYAERAHQTDLDLPGLRDIFDELAANEIFVVDIAGGDPFARADIIEILAEMAKRQFVFFVSTKHSLSQEQAMTLAELGIGRRNVPAYLIRPLQFSVDTADADAAAWLTRRRGYLARIVGNVKRAVRAGLSPRVKAVLTSRNYNACDGLVELFSDLGVTEFQFVQYARSYYWHDESLFLTAEQKSHIREAAARLREKYPEIAMTFQEDLTTGGPRNATWERWYQRSVCSGGRIHMGIKPNGDVTLCDQIPQAPPFVVANVLTHGVIGAWNAPELRLFNHPSRERFQGSVCVTCTEFDACHDDRRGYCYRDALFAYGTIYEAPPDCPKQTKQGLRQI